MRAQLLAATMAILTAIAIAGCGGNMSANLQSSGVPVSMAIHDTPPAGVTILSFEIHVTGASLQPSDSSKAAVPLVTHDTEIELHHLEVESALLSTAGVPADTYSSLNLTFAHPEMTIQNSSGQTITVGGKSCAANAICELDPSLNSASLMVNSAPFPITLSANSGLSFDLDFDINSSVQTDLSVTPTVNVTTTMTSVNQEMEDIDDLAGQITAVGTNQFTIMTLSGQSDVIQTTTNTQFDDFDHAGCAANNFSCLQNGQIVRVHLSVMDEDGGEDGSMMTTSTAGLVAKEVQLEDHFGKEFQGEIISVNAPSNQFSMVVDDEGEAIQGMALGNVVTVTVNSGAMFDVDTNNITIPSGLQFLSISDVIVGQSVEIDPVGVNASSSGISVATDHVRLHRTHVTATIQGISGANLTLTNLPSFFTSAGITQIQVQTSSSTQFEDGLSGVSGLAANDTVSVGGLLFNSTTSPVLLAEKIRKR